MIIGMEKAGVDHEALLDTYIRAINVITQGRPNDLTIGVHMCRGNFKVDLSHHNNLEFMLKWKSYRAVFIFQKGVTLESQ